MNDYSYDDIYGVDLETYCKVHNTTIDHLIEKIEIDINLLQSRMGELLEVEWSQQNNALITHIYNLIKKKDKHKERLKEWASES